jgi:hypothetical protein
MDGDARAHVAGSLERRQDLLGRARRDPHTSFAQRAIAETIAIYEYTPFVAPSTKPPGSRPAEENQRINPMQSKLPRQRVFLNAFPRASNGGIEPDLPRGSSDASLTPYHVDRSKLFVMDRIGAIKLVDASRIARAIEFTRFPSPPEPDDPENEEGLLVRAADFIGQLGDPTITDSASAPKPRSTWLSTRICCSFFATPTSAGCSSASNRPTPQA